MDRGGWRATVHGVTKASAVKRLSMRAEALLLSPPCAGGGLQSVLKGSILTNCSTVCS